jgi:hypothetical protein
MGRECFYWIGYKLYKIFRLDQSGQRVFLLDRLRIIILGWIRMCRECFCWLGYKFQFLGRIRMGRECFCLIGYKSNF